MIDPLCEGIGRGNQVRCAFVLSFFRTDFALHEQPLLENVVPLDPILCDEGRHAFFLPWQQLVYDRITFLDPGVVEEADLMVAERVRSAGLFLGLRSFAADRLNQLQFLRLEIAKTVHGRVDEMQRLLFRFCVRPRQCVRPSRRIRRQRLLLWLGWLLYPRVELRLAAGNVD